MAKKRRPKDPLANAKAFLRRRDSTEIAKRSEPSRVSRTYIWVRSRQLEGTYPGSPVTGAWIVSASRIGFGWGSVQERDWPTHRKSNEWPPDEPEGLDTIAKQSRTQRYFRTITAEEVKRALLERIPITCALEITEQWYDAVDGRIDDFDDPRQITDRHTVLLLGYDSTEKTFEFECGWGEDWGKSGLGRISEQYFSDHCLEAFGCSFPDRTLQLAKDLRRKGDIPLQSTEFDELLWGVRHPFGRGEFHGREVFDYKSNERIGWAFAVVRDGFLDIEEIFVKPQWRGKGFGTKLCVMIQELVAQVKLPIRLWIPYADASPDNLPRLRHIAALLGVTVQNCKYPFAAYVAQAEVTTRLLIPIKIPPAPRAPRLSILMRTLLAGAAIAAQIDAIIPASTNVTPDTDREGARAESQSYSQSRRRSGSVGDHEISISHEAMHEIPLEESYIAGVPVYVYGEPLSTVECSVRLVEICDGNRDLILNDDDWGWLDSESVGDEQ